MANVQVTFKMDPRFIETTPFLDDWGDITIREVLFIYRVNGEKAQTEVEARLVGTKYQATVDLLANEEYDVKVRITNSAGSEDSAWVSAFDTADTTTYHNVEFRVLEDMTAIPLEDAELVITNPDGADWVSRVSTENGRVWIQRIPSGTYAYEISVPGYQEVGAVSPGDNLTGTLTTTDTNNGFIGNVYLEEIP